MAINYNPLWETMRAKGVTTYQLIYTHNVSKYTIQRLKRNESITIYTLNKLCHYLKCTPNEIIAYIPDQE